MIPTRANDPQGRTVRVWVPRYMPSVQVLDDWSSFGQRTISSGSVFFVNVLIENEAKIFPVWQRAAIPGLADPVSQLIQAAIDSGIAIGALEISRGRQSPAERDKPAAAWRDLRAA